MKIQWKTCFKIGFSIFLLYLCIHYLEGMQHFLVKAIGAASPLIIGCAIAYVVNIIMTAYERHYFPMSKKKFVKATRRPLCMIAAFLTVVAIIVIVVSLVLPELTQCIQLLVSQLPGAFKKLIGFIEGFGVVPEDILSELSNLDWQEKIGDIFNTVSSYFGNVVNALFTVVTAFFSGLVVSVLSIIFAVYLLLAKEKLQHNISDIADSYFKKKFCDKARYVLSVINDSFHKFIVGQTLEAVILGILCTVGMLILRLPYATMIGALVCFTAFIPVVGAFIGAAVGAFMISTVSLIKAVIFIVFVIVLQQLEGNLIYPRVVGASLGLPAILILAAVTVGGGVFGILGMLLGVPLAAAAYKILDADVKKRMAKKEEPETHNNENPHAEDETVKSEN